jgi:hypothetical protein
MLTEIVADFHDFAELKKLYTGIERPSIRDYVQGLLQFASKALKAPMPPPIYNQLHKIGSA